MAGGQDAALVVEVPAHRQRRVRGQRRVHQLLAVRPQQQDVRARCLAREHGFGLGAEPGEVPGGEAAGDRQHLQHRDAGRQLRFHCAGKVVGSIEGQPGGALTGVAVAEIGAAEIDKDERHHPGENQQGQAGAQGQAVHAAAGQGRSMGVRPFAGRGMPGVAGPRYHGTRKAMFVYRIRGFVIRRIA